MTMFDGWLDKRAGRIPGMCLTLTLAALLAACQSDADGLAPGKENKVKAPPSTAVSESFGDAGPEITLMLVKSAAGYVDGDARDVRDGAALAVGELGGGLVRVKVADNSPAEALSAKARGSILLVSYAPASITSALAAVPADQRPILINIGQRVPASGSTFNFASSEADSTIEGARIAVANGHRKFVVFVPSDYPAGSEAGIQEAVRNAGGTVLASPRYVASSAGVSQAALGAQALVKTADAVLVLGNTVQVAGLVAAVKASGATPKLTFIGTSGWPDQAFSMPAATGVIIASVDRDNRALIAERYNRHYGRPLSQAAAYGYDAVALASGAVRATGPTGLTSELLTRKAGFTGISGVFRFTASGQVERKLDAYKVSNGKLERMNGPAVAKK
ncbi:ABC transporter substrate-binding protein [Pararhizobium sp.]|uniref:ABC transporter substrate-binding protein n=1 Tax=Pararhizobium sp. TaxID=1977563 RepID=UPI00271C26B5|nr:hypothetical protein [Pararhizobium sp.]MDO9418470.1 ABC transporter substrate-binding protein [Pararhizobium sp.]